jgi:uncharacterized protein YraI
MRRSHLFLLALLALLPMLTGHGLRAQSGVRAVVVNDSVNIRVAPAIGADVIANVTAGYVFEIITARSADNQWIRVEFNGEEGWVNVVPLTFLAGDIGTLQVADPRSIPYGGVDSPRSGASNATSNNRVQINNGLRLRAGPSQAYPTIGNMFARTIVPVFGRTPSNTWVQVNFEGQLGWVSTSFVTFLDGLQISSLPVDGIVADSPPITGDSANDFFDIVRLMLARLDLAQPSLDNIRAKWTDSALTGRAACRDYPALPSAFNIAVPTLAAYYGTLNPLLVDFNDAIFNLRRSIDLFIEACNQPGTANPVGSATVTEGLTAVNLADRQFAYLRSRLVDLVPPDRELQGDECLFTYYIQQEVLKIIQLNQIVRLKLNAQDRTFGFCIDLQPGTQIAIQTMLLRGEEPGSLVVLTPFDNPTNFTVTSQLRAPLATPALLAPVIVPQGGRYLFIYSAVNEPTTVNAEIAFVISPLPAGGNVGALAYDSFNDVVFQLLPGTVFAPTSTAPVPPNGIVPTSTGTTSQLVAPVTCPSTAFTCSQLTSQEAVACLAAGNTSLDPDGNGIPCEVGSP